MAMHLALVTQYHLGASQDLLSVTALLFDISQLAIGFMFTEWRL